MTTQLSQQLAGELVQIAAPLQITRRKFPFILLVYFICGALMMAGWLVPEMRNLAGLGAAALFVTIALRLSLKW